MKKGKHIYGMPAKIGLFFLLALCAMVCLGGSIGLIKMWNDQIYSRSEEVYRKNSFYNISYQLAENMINLIQNKELSLYSIYGYAGYEVIDMIINEDLENEWENNWQFEIRDSEGEIIAEYSDNENKQYTFAFEGSDLWISYLSSGMITAAEYNQIKDVTVTIFVNESLYYPDIFRECDNQIAFIYQIRLILPFLIGVSFLGGLICFICLMCSAGHRREHEEIVTTWLADFPFDVYSLVVLTLLAAMSALVLDIISTSSSLLFSIITVIGISVCLVIIATAYCMNFAVRVKKKNVFRNTLIFICCRWIWRIGKGIYRTITGIPLVWKTVVGVGVVAMFDMLIVIGFWYNAKYILFNLFLEKLVVLFVAVFFSLMLRKLQKGGEALARGDLNYQIDTSNLMGELKQHGENLNSISVGMNAAVNERMKSERMKTELITNVSHDIKTPLTSIINYTDLIVKEHSENEKINEYASVLARQSARLKKLIEDLVEASKASTGNIEVHLMPMEVGVLLTQTVGEYEEKMEQKQLQLITKQPKEPVRILADGRHLWRVFDNLLNNICKYAQPGTRVYLTVEQKGTQARISFKNTSSAPLDIPAEELMERFVRADSSRSTEGNGLGLSIAQSLASLQKGELELSVDGDLFKATLIFRALEPWEEGLEEELEQKGEKKKQEKDKKKEDDDGSNEKKEENKTKADEIKLMYKKQAARIKRQIKLIYRKQEKQEEKET